MTWFCRMWSRFATMTSTSSSRTSWRRAFYFSSETDRFTICLLLNQTHQWSPMVPAINLLGSSLHAPWCQCSTSVPTLRHSATFRTRKRKSTLFLELSTASTSATCKHFHRIPKESSVCASFLRTCFRLMSQKFATTWTWSVSIPWKQYSLGCSMRTWVPWRLISYTSSMIECWASSRWRSSRSWRQAFFHSAPTWLLTARRRMSTMSYLSICPSLK